MQNYEKESNTYLHFLFLFFQYSLVSNKKCGSEELFWKTFLISYNSVIA
jgi:hypothetical protein